MFSVHRFAWTGRFDGLLDGIRPLAVPFELLSRSALGGNAKARLSMQTQPRVTPGADTPSAPSAPTSTVGDDEGLACFICFESGPGPAVHGRPGELPKTGLCACTTLAVHLACLESFINAGEADAKPLSTLLACRVCKTPYSVTHHVRTGAAALDANGRVPTDLWEKLVRLCVSDERRSTPVASVLRLLVTLLSVGVLCFLIVSMYFAWGLTFFGCVHCSLTLARARARPAWPGAAGAGGVARPWPGRSVRW